MKNENGNINGRAGRHVCNVRGKIGLSDIRDALEKGGQVTILIRHAERPPLDPSDPTFGASLSLTERGWGMARKFGAMLATNTVRPKSVAFYASETFRTLQTACGMAMGLDAVETAEPISKKIRISELLGSDSPFFGSLEERMELIAEGRYLERLNGYFRDGTMRGYSPFREATDVMEVYLKALHCSGDNLVVAVTHDINVAAFLAGRGVVASFTEETWPYYQDAAVIIEAADGSREYGSFRWNEDMEGIDLLDARFT